MIVLSICIREWAVSRKLSKSLLLELTKFSEQEITTVRMISYRIFRSSKSWITPLIYVRKITLNKSGKPCLILPFNFIKSISTHSSHKTKLRSFSSSMVRSWKILPPTVPFNTLFIYYKPNITISTWVAKWPKLSSTSLKISHIWSTSCTFPPILFSKDSENNCKMITTKNSTVLEQIGTVKLADIRSITEKSPFISNVAMLTIKNVLFVLNQWHVLLV